MMLRGLALAACLAGCLPGRAAAQDGITERARRYLTELIRLDTTNPPGNETRAANWLKAVADRESIPSELAGPSEARLNFIARLGAAAPSARPLLLMAHTDVVPADPRQWTVPPFSAEIRKGFLYGRGTLDDKSLLAAELAVLVELKRENRRLSRDIILLAEADEEAGSTGMQWLVRHAWNKIDAEIALNEGGFAMDLPSGTRLYEIQTAEKVPMPLVLRARGTEAHGSLPRPDNPVLRVSRAIVKLAGADQPVRLNPTTRRYFAEMSKLPEYRWLAPMLPRFDRPLDALAAANEIRVRDPELDAQLRTTVSPDTLRAGSVFNVIPAAAEAQLDVRRLPNETREEVIARLRSTVNDELVEIIPLAGHNMPATEPSGIATPLYRAMETVLRKAHPKPVIVPYMQRGSTDASWLRQRGVAVYGPPIFLRDEEENRAHAADERITPGSFDAGVELLARIVKAVTDPRR
jgi:acetylornithine deacetylase/succinyl-diaminopimelate desuccinylase-like protein